MIFVIPKLRGTDKQGSGAYGAPRGDRKHKGLDYACEPGTKVYSTLWGQVTRLGFPYKGNRVLRLIEIEDRRGSLIRYMYVDPAVKKGDSVYPGTLLGTVQKLPYKGITQHVHVDVKAHLGRARRQFVNPADYL